MPWTPRIDAQHVRPLAKNLLRIIKRDAPDALAWAAAPDTVAPFMWFGIAAHVEPRFPFVLVLADTSDVDTDDDNSRIEEIHSLSVQVGAAAADPDKLADEIFIRINAIDSIIREATWDDLLQGIATSSFGSPVMAAGRHEYGQFPRRNANQLFVQAAAIAIKIGYFETKLGVL